MKVLLLVLIALAINYVSAQNSTNSTNTTIINFPSEWANNCFEVFDPSSNISIVCNNQINKCPVGSILISSGVEVVCNIYINGENTMNISSTNLISRSIYEDKNYKVIVPRGVQQEDLYIPYKTSLENIYQNCFSQTVDIVHIVSTGTLSLGSNIFSAITNSISIKELKISCDTIDVPDNKVFRFPKTNVIINALNSTGSGTIDVTPQVCPMPSNMGKVGLNGEQSGSIKFYVLHQEKLVTLIANGGVGQTGGAGGPGTIEQAPPNILCTENERSLCTCGSAAYCVTPLVPESIVGAHIYTTFMNQPTITDLGIVGFTVNGQVTCPLGGPSIPAASAGGAGAGGNIYSFQTNNYQVNYGSVGNSGAPGIGAGVSATTFVAPYLWEGSSYEKEPIVAAFPDYNTMSKCISAMQYGGCSQYIVKFNTAISPGLINCPASVVGPVSTPNPPLPGTPTVGTFNLETPMLHKEHCAILEAQAAIYFRNLQIEKIQYIAETYIGQQGNNYQMEQSVFCSQFVNTIQVAITNLAANLDAWNSPIAMITSLDAWVQGRVSMKEYTVDVNTLTYQMSYLTYAKDQQMLINNAQDSINNLNLDVNLQIALIGPIEKDYDNRVIDLQNEEVEQAKLEANIQQRVDADQQDAKKIVQNTIDNIKNAVNNIKKKFIHAALLKSVIKISKSIGKKIFESLPFLLYTTPIIPEYSAAQIFNVSPVSNYTQQTTNLVKSVANTPQSLATVDHEKISYSIYETLNNFIKLIIELKQIQIASIGGGIIAQRIEGSDQALQQDKQQLTQLDITMAINTEIINQDQAKLSTIYLNINKAKSVISSINDNIIEATMYDNTDFVLQVFTQAIYNFDQMNMDLSMLYNDYIDVMAQTTVIDLASTQMVNRFLQTILTNNTFTQTEVDYVVESTKSTFNRLCTNMVSNYNSQNRMMQSSMYRQLSSAELQNLNNFKLVSISLYDQIEFSEEQQQVYNITFIPVFSTTNTESKITVRFNKDTTTLYGNNLYMNKMETETIYSGKYQPYINQTVMDPPAAKDISDFSSFVGIPASQLSLIMYNNPSVWNPITITISDGTLTSFVLKIDYYYRPVTDTTVRRVIVQSKNIDKSLYPVYPTFTATCDLLRDCNSNNNKNNFTISTFEESIYIYPTSTVMTLKASQYDMYGAEFVKWSNGSSNKQITMSIYTNQRLIAYYK